MALLQEVMSISARAVIVIAIRQHRIDIKSGVIASVDYKQMSKLLKVAHLR